LIKGNSSGRLPSPKPCKPYRFWWRLGIAFWRLSAAQAGRVKPLQQIIAPVSRRWHMPFAASSQRKWELMAATLADGSIAILIILAKASGSSSRS